MMDGQLELETNQLETGRCVHQPALCIIRGLRFSSTGILTGGMSAMIRRFISFALVAPILLACVGCNTNGDFNSKRQLRERAIERVRNGEIKTEQENGLQVPQGSARLSCSAQLPHDLQEASLDGLIYVSKPTTNQLIVVFKTWQGKGFNMEGFLYAAKPLSGAGVSKDYYGHSVVIIGPMELVLERQLDPNWYRVSYKLD